MMRMLWLILIVGLAGCGETPTPEPMPIVCPASATAALEPRPVAPALTDEQQMALDVATILTLGEDLGAAIIRFHDAEIPAYDRRLAARIEQTRVWCEESGE